MCLFISRLQFEFKKYIVSWKSRIGLWTYFLARVIARNWWNESLDVGCKNPHIFSICITHIFSQVIQLVRLLFYLLPCSPSLLGPFKIMLFLSSLNCSFVSAFWDKWAVQIEESLDPKAQDAYETVLKLLVSLAFWYTPQPCQVEIWIITKFKSRLNIAFSNF